jgi:general secretion pathway protein F
VDAPTSAVAREHGKAMGAQVLVVAPEGGLRLPRSRPARFDLILFTQELEALLRAGITPAEAIETLASRAEAACESNVPGRLLQRLREGRSVSEALADMPAHFPRLFVATIGASERTGTLIDALSRYLRYQEQIGAMRQRLISASLYPLMLLVVGLGVGMFLIGFLVPRFHRIYVDAGAQLPAASKAMMAIGMLVDAHPGVILIAALLAVALAAFAWRHPPLRSHLFRSLLAHRLLGERLRLMQLSRLYRSLGMLLGGGTPMVPALETSRELLALSLQDNLLKVTRAVSEGKPLGQCLADAGLDTPVALRLIQVGERNGQLPEMLEQTATFHDKEIARWVERVTRLFEPALMLFIGGIIGGIVILLYLPIFELAGSLQ